jgi:hypothetical protein
VGRKLASLRSLVPQAGDDRPKFAGTLWGVHGAAGRKQPARSGQLMVADEKKLKPSDKAPKEKTSSEPKEKTPVEAKPETNAEAPKNYSRGEGQKTVTQAYKDNWNAIYGKKKKR